MTISEREARYKFGSIELFNKYGSVIDSPKTIPVEDSIDEASSDGFSVSVAVINGDQAAVNWDYDNGLHISNPLGGAQINRDPIAKRFIHWTKV